MEGACFLGGYGKTRLVKKLISGSKDAVIGALSKVIREQHNKKAAGHPAASERDRGKRVTQAALGKAEYEMTDTSICNERSCLSKAVTLSVTSPVI